MTEIIYEGGQIKEKVPATESPMSYSNLCEYYDAEVSKQAALNAKVTELKKAKEAFQAANSSNTDVVARLASEA